MAIEKMRIVFRQARPCSIMQMSSNQLKFRGGLVLPCEKHPVISTLCLPPCVLLPQDACDSLELKIDMPPSPSLFPPPVQLGPNFIFAGEMKSTYTDLAAGTEGKTITFKSQ